MKLELTLRDLREALRRANRLSPTAARQKRGRRIWLRADEGGARLCGEEWGDPLRPAFEVSLPARVKAAGQYQLEDSHVFAKSLKGRAAPDGNITAEAVDGRLWMGGAEVPGAARDGAPDLKPGEESIRFDYGRFAEIAARLMPLCGSDYARPRLTDFQVKKRRKGVRLGVTDSWRLAVDQLPVTDASPIGTRTTARELVRAALRIKTEGEAELGWGENDIQTFAAGPCRLRLRTGYEKDCYGAPVDIDKLLGEFAGRGDIVLRRPRRAAEELLGLGETPKDEYGGEAPVRVWWREGRMEAAFRSDAPRWVGETDWDGETASAFHRDFLVSVLRVSPPACRLARLALPDPDPDTGRFLKPMTISAGRAARAVVMPVRLRE